MKKSLVFTILATLESTFAVVVIWGQKPFLIFLGFAFAFMLWIQFRVMRINSRLNLLLLFSMIVPIIWLSLKIISLFVQPSVIDNGRDPFIMLICPCMYVATMMDIFIRRIDEKIPYIIPWPLGKDEK